MHAATSDHQIPAVKLTSVPGWSVEYGRRCTFDALGIDKCQTGDCGGRLECDGNGAAPRDGLFEITIGQVWRMQL
ncbi:putative thaumatin [Medicago truncatula]|uniref:Putative thaumatin n=1 Tax=Medicago truncatula TaxID=3880 RepID=A0A396HSQ0_MEDTR|nr:putative thaumatin [Medicago truncatula]